LFREKERGRLFQGQKEVPLFLGNLGPGLRLFLGEGNLHGGFPIWPNFFWDFTRIWNWEERGFGQGLRRPQGFGENKEGKERI